MTTSLPITPDVAPPPLAPRRPAGRAAYRVLKYALLAAVLAFVGRALAANLREIDWSTVAVRPGYVLAAAAAMLGLYAAQVVGVRWLLSAFAGRPTWRATAAIAWVPLPGKYVPGKVVAATGAVYLMRRAGVAVGPALSSVVMLDALAVVSGLMVGMPLLLAPAIRDRAPGGPALVAAATVGGLVAVHPAVFGRLMNVGLRVLRRPPLPRAPRVRDYAVPTVAALGQWAAGGLALWCLARAVAESPGDVPISALPLYVAATALSMTLSYLALLAPGGLGVREGLLLAALGPTLGPRAAVVSVGLRVVQVVVEVGLFIAGTLLVRSGALEDGASHRDRQGFRSS